MSGLTKVKLEDIFVHMFVTQKTVSSYPPKKRIFDRVTSTLLLILDTLDISTHAPTFFVIGV